MLSIAINCNLMKLICFPLRITKGIGSVLKKILMAQTNFNCYNLLTLCEKFPGIFKNLV